MKYFEYFHLFQVLNFVFFVLFMWNLCCGAYRSKSNDPVVKSQQGQQKMKMRAVIKLFLIMGIGYSAIAEMISFTLELNFCRIKVAKPSVFLDVFCGLQVRNSVTCYTGCTR